MRFQSLLLAAAVVFGACSSSGDSAETHRRVGDLAGDAAEALDAGGFATLGPIPCPVDALAEIEEVLGELGVDAAGSAMTAAVGVLGENLGEGFSCIYSAIVGGADGTRALVRSTLTVLDYGESALRLGDVEVPAPFVEDPSSEVTVTETLTAWQSSVFEVDEGLGVGLKVTTPSPGPGPEFVGDMTSPEFAQATEDLRIAVREQVS